VSSPQLDLSGKESEPAEEKAKPKRRTDSAQAKRERRAGTSPDKLRGRLQAVFERLAEWLEGRGDEELAQAIREDAGAMTGGLVAATRPLAWLRQPLLLLLALAEPVLAFGRVGRILLTRWQARRERIAFDQALAEQAAAAEQAAERGPGMATVEQTERVESSPY